MGNLGGGREIWGEGGGVGGGRGDTVGGRLQLEEDLDQRMLRVLAVPRRSKHRLAHARGNCQVAQGAQPQLLQLLPWRGGGWGWGMGWGARRRRSVTARHLVALARSSTRMRRVLRSSPPAGRACCACYMHCCA